MNEEFVSIIPPYDATISEDFRREITSKITELFEIGMNDIIKKLSDLDSNKEIVNSLDRIKTYFRPRIVVSIFEEGEKEKGGIDGQYHYPANTIYMRIHGEDDPKHFGEEIEHTFYHEIIHSIFHHLSSDYIKELRRKWYDEKTDTDNLTESFVYKAQRFLDEFVAELLSLLLSYEKHGDKIFGMRWYGFSQYYAYILKGIVPFDPYYMFSRKVCEWNVFREKFVCTTEESYYRVDKYDPLRNIIEK